MCDDFCKRHAATIRSRSAPALALGLMVLMAAKSLARFAGREYVTPDDVKATFLPAMRHRVVLSPAAELEGSKVDDVLTGILEGTEVPR